MLKYQRPVNYFQALVQLFKQGCPIQWSSCYVKYLILSGLQDIDIGRLSQMETYKCCADEFNLVNGGSKSLVLSLDGNGVLRTMYILSFMSHMLSVYKESKIIKEQNPAPMLSENHEHETFSYDLKVDMADFEKFKVFFNGLESMSWRVDVPSGSMVVTTRVSGRVC